MVVVCRCWTFCRFSMLDVLLSPSPAWLAGTRHISPERQRRRPMIRYAVLGMFPLMMFPGCVGEDAGPGSSRLTAGMEQVSVADLQVLAQATPVVRGFVAGGSG